METTAVLFQDFGPSQRVMIELSCSNLAPFFHSQAFGHLKNIEFMKSANMPKVKEHIKHYPIQSFPFTVSLN